MHAGTKKVCCSGTPPVHHHAPSRHFDRSGMLGERHTHWADAPSHVGATHCCSVVKHVSTNYVGSLGTGTHAAHEWAPGQFSSVSPKEVQFLASWTRDRRVANQLGQHSCHGAVRHLHIFEARVNTGEGHHHRLNLGDVRQDAGNCRRDVGLQ